MPNNFSEFETNGFAVFENVTSELRCAELIQALPQIENSGTRSLLSKECFRNLVAELRNHCVLGDLLDGLVAVQCTLFRKSKEHNWAVSLHRDSVIPVHGRGEWKFSGMKEGMNTAQPPREFLDQCIAIRLHLDGALEEDVSVVPGSHRGSQSHHRDEPLPVKVPRGGVLAMRPTILHASSRLKTTEYRRVLHYLFASPDIPDQHGWYHAV